MLINGDWNRLVEANMYIRPFFLYYDLFIFLFLLSCIIPMEILIPEWECYTQEIVETIIAFSKSQWILLQTHTYNSIMNLLSNFSWHKPIYQYLKGIKCSDYFGDIDQITW
jgi:hypothetical protein